MQALGTHCLGEHDQAQQRARRPLDERKERTNLE
ncbi:hypothetical protein CTA1_5668 [Colletotrichum tanaceti]|uniref:Uncharacterized protein n=1 Tax=Colletotrichum tanaceti TaxID=1306861 RepID=A0A4U6X548_9PEZI|nr:hypothetical protein CTA1_5668 [Colletotrichum tanaceti]